MPFVFANNVKTTLAAAATTTQTTLTLASSANLPSSIPAGSYFAMTLNDAATGTLFEIVYVTSISGATVTCIRGQENTGAQAWSVGDYVYASNTAGILGSLAPTIYVEDNFAPLAGNAVQQFSVDTATSAGQAVPLGQAQATFAALGGDASQIFQVANAAPASSAAIASNQINTMFGISPSAAYSAQGVTLGANFSQTLTLSFTAPVSGNIIAFGYINPNVVAAADIACYLAINGTNVSQDTTLLSQSHVGVSGAASGQTMTITLNVNTSTSPNVTATFGVAVLFIPNEV
ncbi:MAG: hypothetical protein ACYDBH_01020 [Acidobacteriaceae bacterium]